MAVRPLDFADSSPLSPRPLRPSPDDCRLDAKLKTALSDLDRAVVDQPVDGRAHFPVEGISAVAHPLARQTVLGMAELDVLVDRRTPGLESGLDHPKLLKKAAALELLDEVV